MKTVPGAARIVMQVISNQSIIKRKSFTIVELLIVVVILTILATFAIPAYLNAKQRAVDHEARSQLKLIQTAEKSYRLEEGQYIACADNAACSSDLRLDLPPAPPDGNWDYSVPSVDNAASPPQFTANSTGTSGTTDWTIDADDVCAYGVDGQYQSECQH